MKLPRTKIILLLLPFLGLGLITTGVWLIYPPAALIVLGALILADLSLKDPK